MAVQLGYVDKWKTSQQIIAPRASDSRIGGLPSFYSKSLIPSSSSNSKDSLPFPHPTCTRCSKPLYLVVQLYAETDRERSLLVYGCNTGSCYTAGNVGTWRVLRTQGDVISATATSVGGERKNEAEPTSTIAATAAAAAASSSDNNKKAIEDTWGGGDDSNGGFGGGGWGESTDDISNPNSSGGGGGGGWGSDDVVASVAASLGSLTLESRAKAASGAGSTTTTSGAENTHIQASDIPYRFPAFDMQSCPEPDDEEGNAGYDEDEDDDGEEEEEDVKKATHHDDHNGSTAKGAAHSRTDDAELDYARKLYESYTASTTNAGLSSSATNAASPFIDFSGEDAALAGEAGGEEDDEDEEEEDESGNNGNDDNDGGNYNDETTQVHSKADKKAARIPGGDKRAGKRKTGGGSGGGGGGADTEKYEKLPPKLRYMLHFQEVVSRLPQQVLRYEWDGEPLWPVPPPTAASSSRSGGHGKDDKTKQQQKQKKKSSNKKDALGDPWGSSSSSSAANNGGGASAPPLVPVAPPRCVCGGKRKFECQLMPQILIGLKPESCTSEIIENHQDTKKNSGSGSGATKASSNSGTASSTTIVTPSSSSFLLPGGMDFMTVFVYSCENSCDQSNEEWAYVVPAED